MFRRLVSRLRPARSEWLAESVGAVRDDGATPGIGTYPFSREERWAVEELRRLGAVDSPNRFAALGAGMDPEVSRPRSGSYSRTALVSSVTRLASGIEVEFDEQAFSRASAVFDDVVRDALSRASEDELEALLTDAATVFADRLGLTDPEPSGWRYSGVDPVRALYRVLREASTFARGGAAEHAVVHFLDTQRRQVDEDVSAVAIRVSLREPRSPTAAPREQPASRTPAPEDKPT
jgi:hypothetical protein